MNVTKENLTRLSAPDKGYALHWDDKLSGFGIRITSTGVISFVLQTRINGRQKRITLGRFGALTVEQARKLAKSTLGDIAGGGDPIAEKARKRAESVSLADAFESYITTRKNLKPRTIEDMRHSMGRMFSSWQNKPLNSITRDQVKRLHSRFGEQHSKARANLGMRYLRAIFNHAMDEYVDADGRPVITDNPVNVLSKQKAWFKVSRRQTVIKPTQLQGWYRAVTNLGNPDMRDYFLLVLLTGLRKSEALDLRWEDVDLDERTLTARNTKNGQDHTLPLSDHLEALLKERDDNKAPDAEFVFTGARGRLSNFRYSLAEVREAAGVEFTLHDLRRTFATVADSLDVPAYAVKALLNHKNGSDVTEGYIVINVERLRKPMQRITDYFLSAWGVRPSPVRSLLSEDDNDAGR